MGSKGSKDRETTDSKISELYAINQKHHDETQELIKQYQNQIGGQLGQLQESQSPCPESPNYEPSFSNIDQQLNDLSANVAKIPTLRQPYPTYDKEFTTIVDNIAKIPNYDQQFTDLSTTIVDNIAKIPNYDQQFTDLSKIVSQIPTTYDCPNYDEQFNTLNSRIEKINIPNYDDRFADITSKLNNLQAKQAVLQSNQHKLYNYMYKDLSPKIIKQTSTWGSDKYWAPVKGSDENIPIPP